MSVDAYNILHLTDLHLTNRSAHDKEQAIVLKALFEDIEQMTVAGMKPDLVIWTGDLANDADEDSIYYDVYERFLEPLLQKTRLTGERLILAPGNHDIQRSAVRDDAARHREFYTAYGREGINNFFRSPSFAQLQRAKLAAYSDIYELSAAPALDLDKGYSIFELPELDTVVCVYNTALTSAGGLPEVSKEDYGKLLVPEYQVLEFCEEVRKSACSIRLLVGHHPLEWLKEDCSRAISGAITSTFDAYFAGHIHRTQPHQIISQSGQCLHLQTGALYQGREEWNGYTIVRASPEGKAYEVRARRFASDPGKFVRAVEMGQDGSFYPDPASRAFWRDRPVADRGRLADWAVERLKPHFLERHEETLVGRSLDQVFYEHPMQSRLSDYERSDDLAPDSRVSVDDIVTSTENYVVFGETNYGKTTLLKRLGFEILNRNADPERVSLPAFFEFKDVDLKGESVLRAVRASLPELGDVGTLRHLLREGLLTVLVDDVDPADEKRMAELTEFTRSYPRCRYIFTSPSTQRLAVGLIADFDKAVSFKEIVLLPLRATGVRAFTQRYFGGADDAERRRVTESVLSLLKQTALPPTAFAVSVLLEVFSSLKGDVLINQVTLIERFIEYLLAKERLADTRRAAFDFNDKVDCLSFLAMRMAREGQYDFGYDALLSMVVEYIDGKGYPYDPGQILDSFIAQKILRPTELGCYRFYLRAFLEYFIAEGMRRDPEFRAWVLEKDRYLSFVHEVEFYSGLARNDLSLLDTIAERHAEILEELRSMRGPIDFDGFDRIHLPADDDGGSGALDDLQEQLSAPALTAEERDEIVDAELVVTETKQDAFRPSTTDAQTRHFLSLTLYSSVIRNSGQLTREAKERHLSAAIDSWIEYLGHSFNIIPGIVKHRFLRINGVQYRVFSRAAISDEKLARQLMLYLPTGLTGLMRSYLGSEKMVRQVEFDPGGELPTITKVVRTFMLSDLDTTDWVATANALRSDLREKPYLTGAVIWKLNSVLKMREPTRAVSDRLIETLARFYSEQVTADLPERQKIYSRHLTDLRRSLALREMKQRIESRSSAQLSIHSDNRNIGDVSP